MNINEIDENYIKAAKMDFGKRLYRLRKEKEKKLGKTISQVELSTKILKMGINTLGYYERGKIFPKIEHLIKIKNYYDVSYDYLLGATDEPNTETDYQVEQNKKAICEIEKIINDLKRENY